MGTGLLYTRFFCCDGIIQLHKYMPFIPNSKELVYQYYYSGIPPRYNTEVKLCIADIGVKIATYGMGNHL